MDRKVSARNEKSLPTASALTPLSDDELSMVSGACHGHHRRRHRHSSDDQEFGGLSWLSQLLQQLNVSNVIQIVTGDNNTVVAGVSQSNSAAQTSA